MVSCPPSLVPTSQLQMVPDVCGTLCSPLDVNRRGLAAARLVGAEWPVAHSWRRPCHKSPVLSTAHHPSSVITTCEGRQKEHVPQGG